MKGLKAIGTGLLMAAVAVFAIRLAAAPVRDRRRPVPADARDACGTPEVGRVRMPDPGATGSPRWLPARRAARGLVVAWLLVLATAYVFPDLVYERREIAVVGTEAQEQFNDLARGELFRQGWRIKGSSPAPADAARPAYFYDLERPRVRLP